MPSTFYEKFNIYQLIYNFIINSIQNIDFNNKIH